MHTVWYFIKRKRRAFIFFFFLKNHDQNHIYDLLIKVHTTHNTQHTLFPKNTFVKYTHRFAVCENFFFNILTASLFFVVQRIRVTFFVGVCCILGIHFRHPKVCASVSVWACVCVCVVARELVENSQSNFPAQALVHHASCRASILGVHSFLN